MQRPLGLIAGIGEFPFEVARAARRAGDRVVAAGVRGLTAPALETEVDELHWFHLGELGSFLRAFCDAGVADAVMAGKIPKSFLLRDPDSLHLDSLALEVLSRLSDRRDDSLLGAFAEALESGGVKVHAQAALTPELLVEEGVLGAVAPDAALLANVEFAWPIAKAIAGLDIGQSVVVKDRAVLAVEAIEGTDSTLERAAELGGAGSVLVKVAKPGQDPRFDVPVIGRETLETLRRVGAGGLAVESAQTVFLQRSQALSLADEAGIVVLGIGEAGPGGERA